MSIRLETIEAETRNSSNKNKNKHQWLLRKCLRIRSSPPKKIPFLNSLNFVVGRRLFTYVVMWVVQDRERASSHTFGCHFWTTSSLWWNYKVHSSLSLFVCLFLGLFCFCFCPIHCLYYMSFRMFYTLYTKMNLDLFFFFFFFFFKGCTSIMHAHLHSVCGSPGTTRLFSWVFLIRFWTSS